MLNKRLNPFIAIIAIGAISLCATFFVLHQISKTDFTGSQYAAAAGH
ncbi:hypothetical protein BH11PAT2_BH11PAT2_08120 [soil metagenome]